MTVYEHFLSLLDEEVCMLAYLVHLLVRGNRVVFPVIIKVGDLVPHEVFRIVAKPCLVIDAVTT